MAQFLVKIPLRYKNKSYLPGDTVELTEEAVKKLDRKPGAIEEIALKVSSPKAKEK